MGQTAFLLVISVFLQDGRHLSAVQAGIWLIPSGAFIAIGAQVGGRLTRTFGTTGVVRAGLALEALGLAITALVVQASVTFLAMLPGFALFGIGIGFAGSQLTNVILSDVPAEKSGAASGANSTVRMIGSSLGIAIVSAILSVLTIRYAVDRVRGTVGLPAGVKARALVQIHRGGVAFRATTGASKHDLALLQHRVADAIAAAARTPLLVATALVTFGMLLSFLIPPVGPVGPRAEPLEEHEREAELLAEAVTIQ